MQSIGSAIERIVGSDDLKTARRINEAAKRLSKRVADLGDWQPPEPDCPSCLDRGVISRAVPFGHPDFGRLFPCPDCKAGAQIAERRNQNLLKQAGMPSKYARFTFDSFIAEIERIPDRIQVADPWEGKRFAYHAAMQFAANVPTHQVSIAAAVEAAGSKWNPGDLVRPGLVLSGPYGVGKTGLMAAIVNTCKDQGERSIYLRTSKFFEHLQSRYGAKDEYGNPEPPTAEDVKRLAMETPILALDEFVMGRPGDTASADKTRHMEDIMEYRKAEEKPTVITCNQTPQEIEQYWGRVICERVFELCHFIPMAGEPLRDTWQPIMEAF